LLSLSLAPRFRCAAPMIDLPQWRYLPAQGLLRSIVTDKLPVHALSQRTSA
jgi:hypothetical protein